MPPRLLLPRRGRVPRVAVHVGAQPDPAEGSVPPRAEARRGARGGSDELV